MQEDASLAAYLVFRAEFEAWHFRAEGSSEATAQPDSVAGSVSEEDGNATRTVG